MYVFIQGAVPLYFLSMAVFTVGERFGTLGSQPYITRRIPASHRGRVASITSIFSGTFSTISQKGAGALAGHAWPMRAVWLVVALLGFLNVCGYLVLCRRDKKAFPLLYSEGMPPQTLKALDVQARFCAKRAALFPGILRAGCYHKKQKALRAFVPRAGHLFPACGAARCQKKKRGNEHDSSGKNWPRCARAMEEKGVDGVCVDAPSADPHMSEYLPEHWRSRAWLSGFTGLAGTLCVTKEQGRPVDGWALLYPGRAPACGQRH